MERGATRAGAARLSLCVGSRPLARARSLALTAPPPPLSPPPPLPSCSPRRGAHGLPVQPRRRRHQDPAPHHPAHEIQFRVRAAGLLPGHRGRGRGGAVARGAAGEREKKREGKKKRQLIFSPLTKHPRPLTPLLSLPLSLSLPIHRSTSNWRTRAWSGTNSFGRKKSWCGWSTSTAPT